MAEGARGVDIDRTRVPGRRRLAAMAADVRTGLRSRIDCWRQPGLRGVDRRKEAHVHTSVRCVLTDRESRAVVADIARCRARSRRFAVFAGKVREPGPIRRDAMAGAAGDRCRVKGHAVATGTRRSAVRDDGQGRSVTIVVRAERRPGDEETPAVIRVCLFYAQPVARRRNLVMVRAGQALIFSNI